MLFGRLVLTQKGRAREEFRLAKANVTIGRAADNDVVLSGSNVSRHHARVESSGAGCTVVDLGSGNGTRVNGVRTDRASLSPGDVVEIGSSSLRFEPAAAEPGPEMTRLESMQDLETTLASASLEVQLEETDAPRLAVYTPGRTWEAPILGDALTIGRHSDNDVVIESLRASRKHARVVRVGDSFVIRDLGSHNGTWLGERRISEHTLRTGDTLRIGNAQLVFKGGFSADDLTVVDSVPAAGRAPRRPVVIVPGLMGSTLWQGNECVWPNIRMLFLEPERYRLQNGEGEAFEPRGLVNEVVIVPNLIKLERYSILVEYLEEVLGYERGKDLLEFPYDFRRDVRIAARQLAEAIDRWPVTPPITIIAHSLGCLVSRYYVERLGGKRKVGRLILLGGPHAGVPQALYTLLTGKLILPLGLLNERLRNLISTFPSSFQILPTYPCARDQQGRLLDLFADPSWLPEPQRPLLNLAREFRAELGTGSSVPTVCIFGYGLKTIVGATLERDAGGRCEKVDFEVEPNGDAVIPVASTVMEGAEIHPVRQCHGILFVDNDVKMRLKMELTR